MNNPLSLQDVLRRTIIDGRLAVPLIENIEDLETVDTYDEESTSSDALEVIIREESILSKLDPESEGAPSNRYETEGAETSGDKITVLNLRDANLNRIVEAKVLDNDADLESDNAKDLIHEALILSYLDHPGIPPVYDLDLSSNHQVYCTIKKAEGISLDALTEDIPDGDVLAHKYDTVSEIVNIFIKVAEIISYAHSRKVVHRDLKPSQIIVGQFGEVYVLGWKNALDQEHDDPRESVLRGTPLYMSPEQANCAAVDARSDIYSLGASLYQILLKRPHMMRDDVDAYWAQKKLGTIDDQKDDIIAAPLLAICLRCLAANPDQRYQDIQELIADLRHYQTGHMVDVYKYGTFDLVKYWLKNNAMHLKWALSLLLIVLIAGAVAYQFYLRGQAGWGSPVYTENFDKSEDWRQEWTTWGDKTQRLFVEDQRLVTRNGPEFLWFYKKRLHGGVALEFEGEMLPGSAPGDLSIVYSPDISKLEDGNRPDKIYYLQHGAIGNGCSMIDGPAGRLDYSTLSLENGVKYKIRGVVDGKLLRLYLNGELICSYDLLFPMNSGYIGLYAYYDNKAIDNVKIYNRELPKVTNIIKTGDLLFENGLHELAMERYQKINELYPGTEIGRESQYKIGLCHYNMENVDQAFAVWKPLAKSEFAMQINFYRWNELVRIQDYNELLRQMYSMYRSANPRLRTQIREQWGLFLSQVRKMGSKDLTREFIRFRDKNFPDDQIFSLETYHALLLLEDPKRAIELFPEQDLIVSRALNEMGEYQRVLDKYGHMRSAAADAMFRSGRSREAIDSFPDLRMHCFGAMMSEGWFEEAERVFGNAANYRNKVLLVQAKYDQIIKEFPDTKSSKYAAWIRDLDAAGYIKDNPVASIRSVSGYDARTMLLLDRYIAGDKTVIDELYENETGAYYQQRINRGTVFQVQVLADLLLHLEGESEPLMRSLQKVWKEKKPLGGQRHWYCVGLMLGKLSKEEFFAQPLKIKLECDYYFYSAIAEELLGNKARALEYYESYKSIPAFKDMYRESFTIQRFVQFRMNALK